MNTSIIYEVNEDYAGIPKDWSARIIGVFDNLTLVKFVDGQGLYALFEGALYSEELKKVTLKFTKNVYVFDSFFRFNEMDVIPSATSCSTSTTSKVSTLSPAGILSL